MKNIKFASSETIDLRDLQLEDEIVPGKFGNDETGWIEAFSNGKNVGFFQFTINNDSQILYVDGINVKEEYQNLGIGTVLYKEFGRIYSEKYNGWPVGRYYMNPIAEYAFRKAVSLGYIPEIAVTEDITRRSYSPQNNELWQDLRNKLPEDLRGPERWALNNQENIKFADVSKEDLRSLEFDIETEFNMFNEKVTSILAKINGEVIGYFDFTIYNKDKYLHVDMIEINYEYQNYGIGTALYREFGKIYNQNYNGWPIDRYYVNPVAEYAFRKAVSLGYISETAISPNMVRRFDNDENEVLWQDLRNKLPEDLRGPEKWESYAKKVK